MKTWILRGIILCILFAMTERFCHKQTKGFRMQKIQADLPYNPQWDTLLPADHDIKKLRSIFAQPFYFLDCGGESYAFASKDGKYVLKFFKLHHMRPKRPEDFLLPPPLRNKYRSVRTKRLANLFSSCVLAYEKFRAGCGLLYLHLNQTDLLKTRLTFYDAIGALHSIDLDTVPFALQEKAVLAYPTLTALASAQEYDAAKRRLSSLLDLIVARCQAGLSDHDARARNFGFIGDQAIEIDLGSFTFDADLKTPSRTHQTLLHETLKLRRYLKKRHPELIEFFDKTMQKHLTTPS
jgi:hypothetical protein